jgi:hypothetical protein
MRMNPINRSNRFVLLAVVLLSLLASCAKKFEDVDGRFMVVNASPGLGPIDIYIDDVKFNTTPLSFPNTTGYKATRYGMHVLKAKEAGQTATTSQGNLNIIGNVNQSLFFYGEPGQLQAFAVTDDLTFGYDTSKSYIRFFHLASGVNSVNVGTSNGGTFTPVFNDRKYETNDSAIVHATFVKINPGNYAFELREPGASTSFDTVNGVLLPGRLYTLYSHGVLGSTGAPVKIGFIPND